jgi:hypothetical protein
MAHKQHLSIHCRDHPRWWFFLSDRQIALFLNKISWTCTKRHVAGLVWAGKKILAHSGPAIGKTGVRTPGGVGFFSSIFGFGRARPEKCPISMVLKNSFYGHISLGVFYDPMLFARAWGTAQFRVLVSKMHLKTHKKRHCGRSGQEKMGNAHKNKTGFVRGSRTKPKA